MICKIAGQKIGVLMRLRNLIPTNTKLMLSKQQYCRTLHIATLCGTFAEPVILVKSSGWKKGVCVLFFRNNVSYPELPSLQNRRLQDICVLMYKAKNNLRPPYVSDIFIKHRSKCNLRQSNFSAARYNKVTYGKHSLRHLGPNLWEKLSPDLREVTYLH